jgi:hypothetical protein
MGLIKRGLVALSAFFGIIYAMVQFYGAGLWPLGLLFTFALPVLVMTVIFDSFARRRRINAGEIVEDDIDDILHFIRRNRKPLCIFLLFMLAMPLGRAVFTSLAWLTNLLGRVIPLAVIGWVVYVLFKNPKKERPDE